MTFTAHLIFFVRHLSHARCVFVRFLPSWEAAAAADAAAAAAFAWLADWE